MNGNLYFTILIGFIGLSLLIYIFHKLNVPKVLEDISVKRSLTKIYFLSKMSYKASLILLTSFVSVSLAVVLLSSYLYPIVNILVYIFAVLSIAIATSILLFLSSIGIIAFYRYYLFMRRIEIRSLKIKRILLTVVMIIILLFIAYYIYPTLKEIAENVTRFFLR